MPTAPRLSALALEPREARVAVDVLGRTAAALARASADLGPALAAVARALGSSVGDACAVLRARGDETLDTAALHEADGHTPRHVLAVPIRASDDDDAEVLGVLTVTRGATAAPFGRFEEALVGEVAEHVAAAIVADRELEAGRAGERAAESRARARIALLANASEVLAGSLDWETTLHNVIELALPALGDFGFFDVVEPDGEVRRLALARGDARRQAILDQTRWQRSERTDLNLCALSSGTTGVHPAIGEAWLRDVAVNDGHYAVMDDLAFASMLTVPLRYADRVLGALTLFHTRESGQRHGADDVRLAEELALRAAAAVENARLFAEARAAVELRDQFLSIAGHELRTPLTALQLQLDALARTVAPAHAPRLDRARAQVTRFAVLIDELLDVSRIAAGRLRLEPSRFDLAEAVDEVLARFVDERQRAGCELTASLEPALVGTWDRLRVEQIVSNLISNALKYGRGKPIEVTLARAGDAVRLVVRDHGIGIAAADLARVFERFERAVSARNFGGLGLGLWIVRQLVEAHGGTIQVTSEPGAGATFEVELPTSSPGSAA